MITSFSRLFILMFFTAAILLKAADPGRKAYEEGNFSGAWKYYQDRMEKDDREWAKLNYNAGTAAQKLQDMESAEKYYARGLNSDDSLLRSRAHYNLGQLFLNRQKGEQALDQFTKSIILNPEDLNAKAAFEQAKQMMQQQQQQQQQDRDQEQQDQQQNEQQQQQQQQQDQNDDENKENAEQQQQQKNEQQMAQQQANLSESQEDIPQDQVENILNAMRERELESMKKLLKEKHRNAKIKRSKDW